MMRRRTARHPFVLPAIIAIAAIIPAACSGSDSSSIVESGNQATTTPAPAATAAPGASTPDGTGETVPTGETADPGGTTPVDTTPAPTTTASPLDSLPDCPTDALDAVTSPVEITMWHGMSSDVLGGELLRLTDGYNASQDKVKVSLIDQNGYEGVIDKYLQSGQDGRPDVAQMPEYMVQGIVDTDSAVPVQKCIESSGFDTSAFLPGAMRAFSTEGVQWSMPFNVSDPVLIWNKKVFAAAGLDPDVPPASLQDVRDFSQKIVDSGAAKYGFALESGFDSGGGWYLEQWFAQLEQPYTDNDNGRSARATKVVYDNPSGVDLLTSLQSMLNDGLAVNVGDNPSPGIDNLLKLADSSEPAAMTIASSATLGSIIDVLKGGQFPQIGSDDVGVGPLPGPDGAKGAIVGGASLWVTNSGDPARIAASWDYISYLVGAAQQSSWSSVTGYVAVRDDARDLDPLKTTLVTDPRFAVALDQLLTLPDAATSAGPVLGPLREVRTVTAQGVAAIFGGADVAATLADSAATSNALITDYNSRNG